MKASAAPIVDRIRIVPRPSDFLDRNVGSSGEVFYDKGTNSLRVYSGRDVGGFLIAKADLSNISDDILTTRIEGLGLDLGGDNNGGGDSGNASITVSESAPTDPSQGQLWFDTASGVLFVYYDSHWIQPSSVFAGAGAGGSGGNSFSTIAVSGQTDLTASGQSTLNLVAGSNIIMSTDPVSNSVTISATAAGNGGGASNAFSSILVPGQSGIQADSVADSVTFTAGSGIVLTTDPATDEINIEAVIPDSVSNFTELDDVTSAGLNVSLFYEPAIVMLRVNNVGVSAYTFGVHYPGNNPTIYAISGTTMAFDLSAAGGHPFEIQDATLTAIQEGLTHIDTDGSKSTGLNAQGKSSGVLYWNIPASAGGTFVYQCQAHAAMFGTITVKSITTI